MQVLGNVRSGKRCNLCQTLLCGQLLARSFFLKLKTDLIHVNSSPLLQISCAFNTVFNGIKDKFEI